ncbi:MAG: type II secretion system protein GspL [Pseudomonadales bacterium]
MPLLCLRLLSEAVQEEEGWSLAVQWLLQGEDGGRRGGGVTDYRGLKDLLDPHQDWIHDPANVLLLVPHDQLLEISVSVPGRNAGQMRRALPYAVEEFTTADVDSLHIASDVLRAGHPTRCQLIDKTLLENWLACLRSLGVEAGYLHTDTEMLPVADGEVFVLVDGPSALIRTATEAASVDRVNLLLALQTLAPASVRIAGGALTDLESAQLPETRIEQLADGGDVMAFLLAAWRRGRASIFSRVRTHRHARTARCTVSCGPLRRWPVCGLSWPGC